MYFIQTEFLLEFYYKTDLKYYADGENAFDMRRKLSRELFGLGLKPGSKEAIAEKEAAEIAEAKEKVEAAN
jgi:hypothetical protein